MSRYKIISTVLLGLLGIGLAQVDTAWVRRWTSPVAGGTSPSSDYVYGLGHSQYVPERF